MSANKIFKSYMLIISLEYVQYVKSSGIVIIYLTYLAILQSFNWIRT